MKLTLADLQVSRLPQTMGYMPGDLPRIAAVVNEAQERLIHAGGETGWAYGWIKALFSITATNPYVTLPRQFCRIINMDVCNTPIRINNEFFEVLPSGIGLQPTTTLPDWCGTLAGFERGFYPTMVDVTETNQLLRVYTTDVRDVGKRILITGLDQNGYEIYSQDGTNEAVGTYLEFEQPFSTTAFIVTHISAIQKDVTYGDIILKQVDSTTGAEVTLSRFAPTETNPQYRRYYITKLPTSCCLNGSTASTSYTVTAMCKLEFIHATNATDQLIIQNKAAIIEECQSIRYSEMDTPNGAALADYHHKRAIKELQNQIRHVFGEQTPAVNVDIFQGAALENQSIGTLI